VVIVPVACADAFSQRLFADAFRTDDEQIAPILALNKRAI
jgi:hypothetical protein